MYICKIAREILRTKCTKTNGTRFTTWSRRYRSVLVIPKLHIPSLDAVEEEHQSMLGHLMLSIKDIAAGLDLENGYRIVVNVGEDGMQTVRHLHVHLLGKRRMQWPPG